MSEYQYVAFRAIDAPVSEENLRFMRRQSTRAEITAWAFDNEYHFGDFNGDAEEMLRRGYDFHLHYADFGIRKLMIRFPDGLPDAKAAEAYFEEEGFELLKDKRGRGGILCVEPYHEAGDEENLFELDAVIERLIPLREEILAGDLRPLYLANLAVACDGNHDPAEQKEAPVPAGLDSLTRAQRALAEFFGLSDALLSAAAKESGATPQKSRLESGCEDWVRLQAEQIKNDWLSRVLADPRAARAAILAEFQKANPKESWPTGVSSRTISELRDLAEEIQDSRNRKRAQAAARNRAEKLARMAQDPTPTLRETDKLVKERSRSSYSRIAELLADLREALSGTDKQNLPESHAQVLKRQNPTLNTLTAELRSRGFLKKPS
jgi:hypothetical protein